MIWEEPDLRYQKRARRVALLGALFLMALLMGLFTLVQFDYVSTMLPVYREYQLELRKQAQLQKETEEVETAEERTVEAPVEVPREVTRKSRETVAQRKALSRNLDLGSRTVSPQVLPTAQETGPARREVTDAFGGSARQRGSGTVPVRPGLSGGLQVSVPGGDGEGGTGRGREVGGGSGQRRVRSGGLGTPEPGPSGGLAMVDPESGPGREQGGDRRGVPERPEKYAPTKGVPISPIIDWIEKHQKSIPVTLRTPENLNQIAGDVTTWVEYTDPQGRRYILYLLGRRSTPPQLNIFVRQDGEGTLLQDLGAKGASESYKHGRVAGAPDNPTVQLELLPPGDPRAGQMMSVFTAWWAQVDKSS
ncbi:MAG: hypothetical protein C4524_00850 [Candidatus Zixiibacteriota bacterium]|nr:MAG: hypothetical protein C4524_00850 [candidate division Zixibacteria bacterium]